MEWTGRRRGVVAAYRLVPDEVADQHRAVVTAAGLPGVVDGAAAIEAADDALLEVAALLAGRPARVGAQRRFVATRVIALAAMAAALVERHEAWSSARAEVEQIAFPLPPVEPAPVRSRPGLLVGAFVVVLFPVFLAWDLLRAVCAASIALLDGVALRVSTVGTTVARAARSATALARRARTVWDHLRTEVIAAASDARRRVIAAPLRLRLAVQHRRRRLRLR